MCRVVNWSFLLCDREVCGSTCKTQVIPCHRFSHATAYPWSNGMDKMVRPLCWDRLEYRDADILCTKCFAVLVEAYDKNDPDYYSDSECYHKNPMPIVHPDKAPEVIHYWEPGLPQDSTGFNPIDWNPGPKFVSPNEIPLSPQTSAAVAELTAELLNLDLLDHVEQVLEVARQKRLKEAAELEDTTCSPFSSDDSDDSDDDDDNNQEQARPIDSSDKKPQLSRAMSESDATATKTTTTTTTTTNKTIIEPAAYISPRRRCTDSLYHHTNGAFGTRPALLQRGRMKLRPGARGASHPRHGPPLNATTTTRKEESTTMSESSSSLSTPPEPPTPEDPFPSWDPEAPSPGWAPKLTIRQLASRWL